MKNEPCPNCGGMLGVPDKLRGQPIECPVCHLEFVPGAAGKIRKKEQPAKSPTPMLRALPVPASIASKATSIPPSQPALSRPNADHQLPPLKSRLPTPVPEPIQPKRDSGQDPSVEPDEPRKSAQESVPEVAVTEVKSGKTVKPSIARIIKSEFVQPQLTKDGKLPTLQLVDEKKPKEKDSELKSNPVFVGLLVCFSLITSGVMLFVVGMQPSEAAKKVVEARETIHEFYDVRIDQEVAPYQRELREAQLANSRGDFQTEIQNYENVMARFHAEDRNQFKGLTGSPTGDIQLEELVSILLNEAKHKLKKGR